MRARTAEIEWRDGDGSARFCLVSRGRVLAESPPLEWPPRGPASMRALVRAVEELERHAEAAGWTALPAGSAWYAKRFAFEPEPGEAEPRPDDRPFGRNPVWPPELRQGWRCEIGWDAGWAESRFRAIAYRPGARRGRALATSAPLRWQLMRRPDPRSGEHRCALDDLSASLEAAGWAPAGAGASWYARRFAWPPDGPPPNRLDEALSEKG